MAFNYKKYRKKCTVHPKKISSLYQGYSNDNKPSNTMSPGL